MNSARFRFFSSVHKESDLLIGVSHKSFHEDMQALALEEQTRLYHLLTTYSESHPEFRNSLEALSLPSDGVDISQEVATMYRCGISTGTGPMSCVAGLFAEAVASRLIRAFEPDEIVVENGGDIYTRNSSELVSVIHAGSSSLSGKIGLVIPGGEWGICTSSGTVGHSFSRGKADAVTVVSASTPIADAWATALANQVKEREDIEPVLERVAEIPEILACVVIVKEQMGIRGEFELKLLS